MRPSSWNWTPATLMSSVAPALIRRTPETFAACLGRVTATVDGGFLHVANGRVDVLAEHADLE